jgi:hypothetical protein
MVLMLLLYDLRCEMQRLPEVGYTVELSIDLIREETNHEFTIKYDQIV